MTAKQTNPQKPKARNGKPLMSELLTETRKYIELFFKMSVFTSTFGEKYRHSNPNDPNNLGGFDKRLFRNNVRFQKDFRQYGSLSL